jgi:hypothetical protein
MLSLQELVPVSPLSVLTGCLEAAFAAAHLIDSPQLQGSSCLGWVMVPEVQTVVTSYAERFMEQVGAQVRCEAVCCINWTGLSKCALGGSLATLVKVTAVLSDTLASLPRGSSCV